MPKRYEELNQRSFSFSLPQISFALREKFRRGYSASDFKADLMAGVVVGMVAIPLSMALAIASGVAPQQGLYTLIIGGILVALLGGSRFQVTGPTAAFVVILLPIVQKFGFAGLLVAGFMAGIILVLMSLAKLGTFIEFIPHPVTTGFTSGIALVIATIQLKDFFGLTLDHIPETYFGRVAALISAAPSLSLVETGIGISTLLLLLLWPRWNKKIPAPLVVLTFVTGTVVLLQKFFPELSISTIQNHFSFEFNGVIGHGIPQNLPRMNWPWNFSANGTSFVLDWKMIQALLPSAFAIAMLGAIESLLCAVVADGMGDAKHDPNSELFALGIANILCPFFGAVAATGALARTATNIRFGARSPLSSVVHSCFALVVIVFAAPFVSLLPMAALAALLLIVAYNMAELKHFQRILKVAPRSDVAVLLICFLLTVIFDMVIGVSVGVILAAFLFMKEMSDTTFAQALQISEHPDYKNRPQVKQGDPILIYEIAGPLFFGAVERSVQAIENAGKNAKVVIFEMDEVPSVDISGLVAFESAVARLRKKKRGIFLVGVRQQPAALFSRSEIFKDLKIYRNREEGILAAKEFLQSSVEHAPRNA